MTAVELRGVTKDFTLGMRGLKLRAVDDLTLRLEAGWIHGLLGANGSGKSTVLKMLLGLVQPTVGDCALFGVPSASADARRRVGFLPEAPYFHAYLTGLELVEFHGKLSGLSGRKLNERVMRAIESTGMKSAAERPIGTYSKGLLQRIGMAQALVDEPRLLILDEPMAGVDLDGVEAMRELLLRLKFEGATILLTSHAMSEVEALCDRVALLDRGRLRWEGALAECRPDEAAGVVVGELGPEDIAELEEWFARRGCALVAASRRPEGLERALAERRGSGRD
ncbi:MAG: transporter ATP-binding protein [Verrucomicrobia bacterium]|nr:transporter ATP-binding protein [Verrucomicrobiota bacterium]